MFASPRISAPIGPGRMALLFDPFRNGKRYWAIVSDKPLHGTKLVGWRRGPGENFEGLYAYRFNTWGTAHRTLLKLLAGHPIQDGKA